MNGPAVECAYCDQTATEFYMVREREPEPVVPEVTWACRRCGVDVDMTLLWEKITMERALVLHVLGS